VAGNVDWCLIARELLITNVYIATRAGKTYVLKYVFEVSGFKMFSLFMFLNCMFCKALLGVV